MHTIQPIPATTVKEKEKVRIKVVKAKEKERTTKENPSREQQAKAPLERSKLPPHWAGMSGTRTVIVLTRAGTMPHMMNNNRTRIIHMPLRLRHGGLRREDQERSKGRGTDLTARNTTASNSFESYTSLIPNRGTEPEPETATAVFPMQHTVLSALTERVNLDRNPTYVILDSGCTRAMGSRYAVNRLIKAVEHYAPGKIEFTFSPSNTNFSFADSETAGSTPRQSLKRDTTMGVLDQGHVPDL